MTGVHCVAHPFPFARLVTVLVRSDRCYRFDLAIDELWARISDVGEYRRWWPWLRSFEADALAAGEIWQCTVQPPVPYALRFGIVLDRVEEPALVTASIEGDITGVAQLDLRPVDGGSEVHLVSTLAPGNRYLRAVARVARPVVRFGHDWVLDTGARQFAQRAV